MAINSLSTGFRPGVCTSSTRPTAPYEGQVIYETDTDLSYVWGGAAWQQVSGGTAVGNSGLVYVGGGALSTATTNFQSCFTSTYRNYRIVIDDLSISAGGWIYIRMLVGSTPNTVAQYESGGYGFSSNASGVTRNAAASTVGYLTYMDSASIRIGGAFDCISPQTTAQTTFQGNIMSYQSAFRYSSANFFILQNSNTQFDGFRLTTDSTPTLSGNVSIYGYRI